MKNTFNVIMFIVITIVITTALFWQLSQKSMYLITEQFIKKTSVGGIPNLGGILLHGFVLGLILAILLTIAGHFLLME